MDCAGVEAFGSETKCDFFSQTSSPARRPKKRRRLSSGAEDGFTSGEDDISDTNLQNPDLHDIRDQSKRDDIDEQCKPKSKYKIHIPKNSEIPMDAFFTQPPERSSSPYRIEQFHWKKPKRQSPVLHSRIERSTHQSSQSFTAKCTLVIPNDDNTENEPPLLPASQDLPDDDFPLDDCYANMLAELPSDPFPSPNGSAKCRRNEPIIISSQQTDSVFPPEHACVAAPLANLRQTTLFGTQIPEKNSLTQSNRKHIWPLANREEPPTHHQLDSEALKTWVYPTNLGTIRGYQYSIVARGLYHNMLVALPTGLGKTFIAATIMLNWFRWTKDAQIVFVAPTKPLVSQQVKACFDVAGIPRSATTMLTGGISPGLRAEEWQSKRVFFMTPQTIINDLKTGICDPKKLVLLVVDEAHRATGGYAYVEVVKFLRRFNKSFRVLALTATPGASIESVQEVIDGLSISRVEIRTEESLDIRQYVHPRKIETILFNNSDEMAMAMDLFSKALQPVLDKLNGMNAYWMRDPMSLTPFGCNQARQRWMASDASKKAAFGIKGMVNTIFSLLASLAHGIELLKFHGIGPFYHKALAFRNEIRANGKKGGKYAKQIDESKPFQTMMSRMQTWINNPDFIGHPKLEYLQNVVINHFLDAGEGRGASDPSSTKIMVFAHYRDSAEEIVRVLRRNEPMVRPHVFVGQANSKGSEGMDQKSQLDVVEKFQRGIYNTLVATSIGEEGLDIGEIDLIVCYDASASPIRMLQRMGRTGRKRAGNIVVTLMKGKEENNFIKAKDNYEKMQAEIALGTRFTFHDEESRRIVPKEIQPVVDKRIIEIPPENTQPDLPEPTKRGRPPKRPPKKFHMPDGVRTGFVKASKLDEDDSNDQTQVKDTTKDRVQRATSPEPLPSLDEVLLSATDEKIFERKYLDIQGDSSQIVEVPRNDAFPILQRILRPTHRIKHGRATKRFVGMLQTMHALLERDIRYEQYLTAGDIKVGKLQADRRTAFFQAPSNPGDSTQALLEDLLHGHDSLPLPAKDSSRASTHRAISTSSTEEEGEEATIHALIDETSEGDIDGSCLIKPSSLMPKPACKKTAESPAWGSDSGNELPEFGTLVHNAGGDSSKMGQRRRTRKIIQDESEEE